MVKYIERCRYKCMFQYNIPPYLGENHADKTGDSG